MTNEITNGKDLVEIPDVPAIGDDRIIEMAEKAEKRIEAVKKIKSLALKLTNSYDWTDQNGKPYLQVSGAEKIARLFGISWTIDEPNKENLEGGHYTYTYKGTFSAFGAVIEAIGSRSSQDGFFKKYSYEKGKDRVELPPSEIDPGDIKKAAYTNCIGNGVTRILGIRNLKWEEVEQYSGVKRSDVAKVEYKSSGKQQPQGKEQSPTNPTAKQVKMIFAKGEEHNLSKEETTQIVEWWRKGDRLTKPEASELIDRMVNDFDSLLDDFMEARATIPEQEPGDVPL